MLGNIFSVLGKKLGAHLGGGILSTIARSCGKLIDDYIAGGRGVQEKNIYAKHRDFIQIFKANYGDAIPLVFGKAQVMGKLIWAGKMKQSQNTNDIIEYFQGSGDVKSIKHVIKTEFTLSFAMFLCEGEISKINKLWAGGSALSLSDFKYRIYKGSQTQMPDPLILADRPEGKAPAFRGIAYIVFEDFPLNQFENKLPELLFELQRPRQKLGSAHTRDVDIVENMIKSIVMIPGSGEYVYDTMVQYKEIYDSYGNFIDKKQINNHNEQTCANSIKSLEQLSDSCPNIEWVSLVVCWFADSLDIAHCNIFPAVEHKDEYTRYTEDWQVAGQNRDTAQMISRDYAGYPRYGGSVNDASILRYIKELKARGKKIMLCPMILLDIEGKPWRGHVTGDPMNVHSFFHKEQGYNNFIIHYAKLTKNIVDAFLIGSEMKGLTSICDGQGNFPAVSEFVSLAGCIKEIMGNSSLVSYGADWSEYHHAAGGWYNMDPLWASENIDFIGIDAYFPITNSRDSFISDEDLRRCMSSGEGIDFYFDENMKKQKLEKQYAWKNIDYWWNNYHINPDGNNSMWQPQSKKIWFTEYGFPSVDKASNQPNVFFDPLCSDGGLPRYSSGKVDFLMQRRCIRNFIIYWRSKEYIDNMFLWTWDARPYPEWPERLIWSDRYLWKKGHWVNNKFGSISISDIILELSDRAGISASNLDISEISETITGIAIKTPMSIMDVINSLRIYAFFDIDASESSEIKFIKRIMRTEFEVDAKDLVAINEDTFIESAEIEPKQIVSDIRMFFIDCNKEIMTKDFVHVSNENASYTKESTVKVPILMSSGQAKIIGRVILENAEIESRVVFFKLPITKFHYQIGDFVRLDFDNVIYHLRIIGILMKDIDIEFMALQDSIESYFISDEQSVPDFDPLGDQIEDKLILLSLPFFIDSSAKENHLVAYLKSHNNKNLYISDSKISMSDIKAGILPHKLMQIKNGAIIGKLVRIKNNMEVNFYIIDRLSKMIILCPGLDSYFRENNWHMAMAGREIFFFKNCARKEGEIFELTEFIRGAFATHKYMSSHESQEDFLLLQSSCNILNISDKFINNDLYFYLNLFSEENFIEKKINIDARCCNIAPPIVREVVRDENTIQIKVQGISFENWKFWAEDEPVKYHLEIFNGQIQDLALESPDGNFTINTQEREIDSKSQIICYTSRPEKINGKLDISEKISINL